MTNTSKKLILIVDDSIDNQNLLELLFSAKGHKVISTSNGIDALSLLKELSHLPNLILLDARMPLMDGYQFRIEQKKNFRLRDIPVIVMTGDSDINMNEKMSFPDRVLVKPLSINSIREACSDFLN